MIESKELETKVIQWCKEDSITIKKQEKPLDESVFNWSLNIGNVVIYCQKRYSDRIFYQNEIKFSSEQIQMMGRWPKEKMNNLLANLARNAIEFDYTQEFLLDGKTVKGIRIHKFTVGDISKSEFLQTLIRIQSLIQYNLNLLTSTMGVEMNLKNQQEQAKSTNPLSS